MRADTTPVAGTSVDIAPALDAGRFGGYQRFAVSLAALSVIIDGIDSQLLGIAIPQVMRDWGIESRSAFAPVLSAGFIGMMAGGALAGVAGDRAGRRLALIASVLMFGVATLGASFAAGLIALGTLRFCVGVGLQGTTTNAATLVAEFVPLRSRAFAVTATVVCIPAGAMLAGLIAIPILPAIGWRGLFSTGGLVAIAVVLVLLKYLPESPRYLARIPRRWPELTRLLGRMGHHYAPGTSFADSRERVERSSVAALFGAGSLRDTMALWSAFSFCLLAAYAGPNWIPSMLTAAGLSSTVANTGITLYNLGGVIGALSAGVGIRLFGSRLTMITTAAAGVAVALGMSTMTLAASSAVMPILVMFCLLGAIINAVQVTLYALAAHVYPAAVRATGVGMATSIGRVGTIASAYAGAAALDLGGSRSFFLMIAGTMFAVCLSLAAVRRHVPANAA